MKVIRTVLGDIPCSAMGVTDAHDHLIRSGGPEVMRDSGFLMDSTEAAIAEMQNFCKAGGKTMVCMDPIGCGRNVRKMLKVAKACQEEGNIVMTTGFQKGENYCPQTSFLATVSIPQIVTLMVAEIMEGMDAHSYNGPVVERTKAKAGVIKAGTSYRIITNLEQKALKIAALTQKETGCAISLHTDFGTMGLEIVALLEKEGANLEKTILCHMQRNRDVYYYQKLLEKGVTLCFEEANKAAYCADTEIGEVLLQLIEKGYEKQLLLGMDGGRREALSAYRKEEGLVNGLDYLLTRFVPLLQYMGISEKSIEQMLVKNPAEVFSIEV